MGINRMTECYSCIHKREVPGNEHILCVNPDLEMIGNKHGIKRGWFFYPFLFDPTWKEKDCSNFHDRNQNVVSDPISVACESK